MPEPDRARLRAIRRGEVDLDEVLAELASVEARLVDRQDSPAVPAEPDRAWVDDWLHRAHVGYRAAG
ncbi:hypothetical protein [Blastococcus sp. SYSU DS0533]